MLRHFFITFLLLIKEYVQCSAPKMVFPFGILISSTIFEFRHLVPRSSSLQRSLGLNSLACLSYQIVTRRSKPWSHSSKLDHVKIPCSSTKTAYHTSYGSRPIGSFPPNTKNEWENRPEFAKQNAQATAPRIEVSFSDATKAPAAPIKTNNTRATIKRVLVSAFGSMIL